MRGTLYGVGVGPGDPELLTLKAARVIRECHVVAVPDSGTGEQVALEIARDAVGDKPVLCCPLPMTRDEAELRRRREESADLLCARLEAGEDVAFLTIGDPTVYSTYAYLHSLVESRGYNVKMIAGVPSFCAAAAALGMPLCEAGEPLHVLPASYAGAEEALDLPGSKVLMKSGKKQGELLALLEKKGRLEHSALAERVGMKEERLVRRLTPDTPSGYLSLVIVKEEKV